MNIFYSVKIDNARNRLSQYDRGQRLILTGIAEGTCVDFARDCTRPEMRRVYIENNASYVDIPDAILQHQGIFHVYFYVSEDEYAETFYSVDIAVARRPRPADYASTDEEIFIWSVLNEKIEDLERKIGEGGGYPDSGSGNIEIDQSLSIEGQAADAKAVGDALADKQQKGDYLTEIPEEYTTTDDVTDIVDEAFLKAKESGEFNSQGFVAQDAPPEDTSVVWIDTSDEGDSGSCDSGKRPDLYNVKRYGATGDGVTDDTAAIASAIAALPSGGTLYFPAGVYRVSNINVKSNMMVQGDGWCSVIKLLDATDDYHGRNNCLNIENVDNIIIRDIKLDGNRPTQQSTAPSQDGRLDGLHIRYASDILVENVWMYNNGYHGCIMTYVTNVVFERCKATDNGFRPIHGHTQIYNCRVSNCVCENNGLGLTGGSGFENDSIFFFGAQHLIINDNIIKSNRRGCITIGCDQDTTDPEDIVPSRNITVSGNVCECYEDLAYVPTADSDTGVAKFSSKGILVYGGNFVMENVTVSGNTIKNAHEAIEFYSQENTLCSINATVCGNAIIDCSYGVFAVDVGNVTIANNQFQNLACAWMYANNVANCLIQGNNVNSPGNSEAYLCRMYNCAGVIIRDNNLIGDCANAIYASDSNSTAVVMNNTLFGFTAAEPITNTNGYTAGNLHIPASDDVNTDKVCIDPYPNSGFVRANLANPNTTSTTWSYTTPVEITDTDTRYELNTFVPVTSGANPAEYDFSSKNTAIVFLSGIELGTAVGIVNLANGNGAVSFSESCVEGTTFDVWGLQIAVSAEKVKELFPGATHVMMQIEKDYAEPDNLSATHKAMSDGHAYVYRAK